MLCLPGDRARKGLLENKAGKDADGALTIGNGIGVSRAGAQRLERRYSGRPERHIAQTGTGPGDTRGSHFCLYPWPGSTHERGGRHWGGSGERQETATETFKSGETLRHRDGEKHRAGESEHETVRNTVDKSQTTIQRHRNKEK